MPLPESLAVQMALSAVVLYHESRTGAIMFRTGLTMSTVNVTDVVFRLPALSVALMVTV